MAGNYRTVACLPLMWKLLTGILVEKLYGRLRGNTRRMYPDGRKGVGRDHRVQRIVGDRQGGEKQGFG